MEIVFASANPGKLKEAQEILGPSFRILSPADFGFTGEIPETHETIPENSAEKALFIWHKFHKPCFADDTGLEIDALGGAPGVYSARYAGESKDSSLNVAKVLAEMKSVPEGKRGAQFRCVVSYVDGEGNLTSFEGICRGSIGFAPVAGRGFGYDPIFIPEGGSRTMSEMTSEEKNAISHRGKAMDALVCHLSKNQGL